MNGDDAIAIQLEILDELRKMNTRLEKVEILLGSLKINPNSVLGKMFIRQ